MKPRLPTSLVAIAAAFFSGLCSGAEAQDGYARCGELPAAVAEMRDRILRTASNGSIEDLAALGDAGVFTASFGGGDTAEIWHRFAAEGTDIRHVARVLLDLDCSVAAAADTSYYTWPAAVDLPYAELTESERRALAELHGVELESLYVEGPEIGYYIGWALTIAEDGDWIALVAGD